VAHEYSGHLDGSSLRVGVVVSQFNESITSRLLDGAREALRKHSVPEDSVTIVRVPGSLELPFAAFKMACSGRWDTIVTLGCVIRGETSHFDLVAGESARGVREAARETGIPITFGVLTTENVEQAIARAGGKLGNRGYDATEAAIKMATLGPYLDSLSN